MRARALRHILKRRSAVALLVACAVVSALWLWRGRILGITLVPWATRRAEETLGVSLRIGGVSGTIFTNLRLDNVRTVSAGRSTAVESIQFDNLTAKYSLVKLLLNRKDWLSAIDVDGLRVTLDIRGGGLGEGSAKRIEVKNVLFPNVTVRQGALLVKMPKGRAAVEGLRLAAEQGHDGLFAATLGADQLEVAYGSYSRTFSDVAAELQADKNVVRIPEAALSPDLRIEHFEIETAPGHFPNMRGRVYLWGGSILAGTKTLSDGRLDLALEARELDIAEALGDFRMPDLLTHGKLALSIEGSMPPGDIRGIRADGNLAISEASRGDLRPGNFVSRFRISDNRLFLDDFIGTQGSSDITGTAALDFSSVTALSAEALANAVVQGEARVTAKDLSEITVHFLPDGLSGRLEADLKAHGVLPNPHVTFSAEACDLGFKGLEFDSVRLQGSFEDSQLELSSVKALGDNDAFSASANLCLSPTIRYVVEMEAQIADLVRYSNLIAPGKRSPSGELEFKVEAKGEASTLSGLLDGPYAAEGALRYQPPANSALPSIESKFSITDEEAEVSDVLVRAYGSMLRASAFAKHRRAELREVTVTQMAGQMGDIPFALSRPTTIPFGKREFTLQEVEIVLGNGVLSATGRVGTDALDLDLELRQISTRALLMPALGDIRQEIILGGHVSLAGALRNPVIEAQLHGEAPSDTEQDAVTFDVNARMTDEGIALENLTVWGDARRMLAAKGWIPTTWLRGGDSRTPAATPNLELEAREVSWSELNQFLPPIWQGGGTLSGKLGLQGTDDGYDLQADIAVSGLMLPGGLLDRNDLLLSAFPADLTIELAATQRSLIIEQFSINTPCGSAAMSATLPLSHVRSWPPSSDWVEQARPFSARAQVKDLRFPEAAPRWLAGAAAEALIEANGLVSDYSADVSARARGLNLPWPRNDTASVTLQVTPDLVAIRSLTFGEPDTTGFRASGTLGVNLRPSARSLDDILPRDSRLDLTCSASENSLDLIVAALDHTDLADGKLTGQLAVTGTLAEPVATLSVRGDGTMRIPVWDGGLVEDWWKLNGAAEYRDEIFSVQRLDLEFPDGRLTFSGQCPVGIRLPYELHRLPPESPWTAQLVLDKINLSILATLFAPLRASAGLASGTLLLANGPARPEITGNIRVQGGDIRLSEHIPPLENIQAEVDVAYPAIRIAPSTAEMGAGKATFEGEVILEGLRPGSARLDLSGKDLLLYRSPDVNCRADLSMRAVADKEKAEVSGDVRIRRLNYSREISFVPSAGAQRGEGPSIQLPDAPWAERLKLDVEVSAEKSLRFRTDVFTGDVSSQLRVGGTALLPILSGLLDFAGSTIRFPYCTFRVETGLVEFSEGEPLRPYLTILAEGKRSGYQITLTLTGPYDRPSVYLSSIPSAPTEDLWTLILTGHTPASLVEAGAGGTAALQVGKYVGESFVRQLLRRSAGDEATDWAERISIAIGAEQSKSGADVIDALVVLTDRVELHAERDEYDDYNMDLVFVLKFK